MNRVTHDDVTAKALAKLVVAGCALLLVVTIAESLASLAAQVVIASFIAVALDTVVRWLERRGMRRGRAVLVVLLTVFGAGVAAALMLLGPLLEGGSDLMDAAPEVVADIQDSPAWTQAADALQVDDGALDAVRQQLVQLPGQLVDIIGALVGSIFGLVNFALMVIFLLTGGERALAFAVHLWPRLASGAPWVVITGAYRSIGQYLLGATAQALLAAASLAVVLWVLGTPYLLPLALLMFLLDYVPLVGATMASIPAVAVTLFAQGTGAAVAMTVFLIVYQQVENAIIQPRIQGSVVNLPVIAIFFSVMVGGQLFGVAGALLAVPTAAIVAIGIDQWLQLRGARWQQIPVDTAVP